MVFETPPPDPVMVIVYVPVGVDVLVDMVIVDDAVEELGLTVTELGLKLADAPDGSPDAEKLIVLEFTPPPYDTVTVAETLPPCTTLPLVGLTEMENVKKFAVTLFGELIVTDVEVLVPDASPVQASKAYPLLAEAVNVTAVPLS